MNPPSVPYCGPPPYRVSCPLSASPLAPPYRACPPSALLFGPPSASSSCPPSTCPPLAYSLCPPSACPHSAHSSCPLSACPLSASLLCPLSTPHPSTLLRAPPYRTLQKPPDSTVEPTNSNTLLCLTTHGVYCRPSGVDCCVTIHHGDPPWHLLFIVNTVPVVTASFLLIHHHYTLDVVAPTAVIKAPSRAAEPRPIQPSRPPPEPDSKHQIVASRKRIVVLWRPIVVSRGLIVVLLMCISLIITSSQPTNSISLMQMDASYGTNLEDEFDNEISPETMAEEITRLRDEVRRLRDSMSPRRPGTADPDGAQPIRPDMQLINGMMLR
eukprot:scaffold15385_cov43-Cyclotella_meneghiniana.AAC.1